MRRVVWTSWSADCAKFDFAYGLKDLKLRHQWINAYEVNPSDDDIWLTSNGYSHRSGRFLKATLYAESYIYLRNEYDNFAQDKRWDFRFAYNPELLKFPNVHLVPIAGYWAKDPFVELPKKRLFGMVLSQKPARLHDSDIGQIRAAFVQKLHGKDFVYYGDGWNKSDPNYKGPLRLNLAHKFLETRYVLSECKFGLALDNSNLPGYLTEKFWSCLGANCVPIYYGHPSVKEQIDNDAFIFGPDFPTIEAVIQYCQEMPEEVYERRRMAARRAYLEDRTHSWEAIFKRMDEILPI